MIILDTDIVNEMTKESPNSQVLNWLETFTYASIYITAITVMELSSGVERMPAGNRKERFVKQNRFLFDTIYAGRVLSFEFTAAKLCGALLAKNWASGKNMKLPDIQIAAIAMSRGFTLATRNVADFHFEGLTLIDPWAD